MTAPDLKAFRKRHDLSVAAAARALGVHRDSWAKYEANPDSTPLTLRWAVTGFESGKEPYGGQS